MDIAKYQQAVIEHLKSGRASDAVWDEVGQHMLAASECEALLLDVELGFAVQCDCGQRVWKEDGVYPNCNAST